MKEKINKYLPWLYVVSIAFGLVLLLILLRNQLPHTYASTLEKIASIFVIPSHQLVNLSVISSINEFGGNTTAFETFAESVIIAGIGLMMVLIVVPFLFVKGYEKSDLEQNSRSWSWYIAAGLLIVSLSASLIIATMGLIVYSNTSATIADSRDADLLRHQLVTIALEASEKMTLPNQYGGGDGSFTSFVDEQGNKTTINLERLNDEANQPYEFIISEQITDSVITLIGISDYAGKDPKFKNANGEIGKRQMVVQVNPHSKNLFSFKNEFGN